MARVYKVWHWMASADQKRFGKPPRGREYNQQIHCSLAAFSKAEVRRITEPLRLWPGASYIGDGMPPRPKDDAVVAFAGTVYWRWDAEPYDTPYRPLPRAAGAGGAR